MERTSAQKPSKINASKHSLHFPPFQRHKKSIRNSLFSNSLSKMLHFFSLKFATTLDFTGFPVISHLFTDGLTLKRPFVIYSVKLHEVQSHPHIPFLQKIYPQWMAFFLSRSQILLLQTEIFSLFKSLEAFNELSWDDVYNIFWINLSVFLDLAATKGCFSEKVLWEQSGFIHRIFLVSTRRMAFFPCIGRS